MKWLRDPKDPLRDRYQTSADGKWRMCRDGNGLCLLSQFDGKNWKPVFYGTPDECYATVGTKSECVQACEGDAGDEG